MSSEIFGVELSVDVRVVHWEDIMKEYLPLVGVGFAAGSASGRDKTAWCTLLYLTVVTHFKVLLNSALRRRRVDLKKIWS